MLFSCGTFCFASRSSSICRILACELIQLLSSVFHTINQLFDSSILSNFLYTLLQCCRSSSRMSSGFIFFLKFFTKEIFLPGCGRPFPGCLNVGFLGPSPSVSYVSVHSDKPFSASLCASLLFITFFASFTKLLLVGTIPPQWPASCLRNFQHPHFLRLVFAPDFKLLPVCVAWSHNHQPLPLLDLRSSGLCTPPQNRTYVLYQLRLGPSIWTSKCLLLGPV